MLSIIVAMDKNNVIGDSNTNKMPWHLPNDLKHFKETTLNKTIIMGRKTFESLPKVLPKRKHIVVSTRPNLTLPEGVEQVMDLDGILSYYHCNKGLGGETFIIGGGNLYRQMLPYVDRMYITRINHAFDGDIKFPSIDIHDWKIISYKKQKQDGLNKYEHAFYILDRC